MKKANILLDLVLIKGLIASTLILLIPNIIKAEDIRVTLIEFRLDSPHEADNTTREKIQNMLEKE